MDRSMNLAATCRRASVAISTTLAAFQKRAYVTYFLMVTCVCAHVSMCVCLCVRIRAELCCPRCREQRRIVNAQPCRDRRGPNIMLGETLTSTVKSGITSSLCVVLFTSWASCMFVFMYANSPTRCTVSLCNDTAANGHH